MTELTSQQVAALLKELPDDYDWILNRIEELKSNPLHQKNYEVQALQDYMNLRQVQLVNLALRRYGCHD